MGICKAIHDEEIKYGFMIDYDKKHGKFPLTPFEKLALELVDVDLLDLADIASRLF